MTEHGQQASAKCIVPLCVINDASEKLNLVGTNGKATLVTSCDLRGEESLKSFLQTTQLPVYVHNSCRKVFNDTRKLKRLKPDDSTVDSRTVTLRSERCKFEWKSLCFFCCSLATKSDSKVHSASTLEFHKTLLTCCDERTSELHDDWTSDVRGRLQSCNDLVAEEAIYHHSCYFRFKQKLCMLPLGGTSGRPCDDEMMLGFEYMCEYLENSCENCLYSLSELKQEISNAGYQSYGTQYLKRKLKERYHTEVTFAEVNGRPDVVCLKDICSRLISDKWYSERRSDAGDESERIVRTAGKLIASSIRAMQLGLDRYPCASDVTDSMSDKTCKWIPKLLQILLKELVSCKVKGTAIGQCIVQSARPRTSILPVPLAMSVSIDNVCGSSELIIETARLGLCTSYDELIRFKQSVVMAKRCDSSENDGVKTLTQFTQFIGDNVDHDLRTLDGLGTFHGMGIISATVDMCDDGGSGSLSDSRIPRLPKRMSASEVTRNTEIPIIAYNKSTKAGLGKASFEPFQKLQDDAILAPKNNILERSLVWHLCNVFLQNDKRIPNWPGFMSETSHGSHGSVAKINFEPLIDMNPGDETCIYSTLMYVDSKARKLKLPTTCVTFDQPLWLKAVDICMACDLRIVCRLGGFHLLMSYLGCIGHVMAGSGIEELFSLNYGSNTVLHIMTGKAYARALRAHFLAERALVQLLLESFLPGSQNDLHTTLSTEGQLSADDILDLRKLCETYQQHSDDGIILSSESVFMKFSAIIAALKNDLSVRSRTAKLWIQYLSYLDIVKCFLAAERTGNWRLHLAATTDMLPLFAACGHHNYAKSARYYVQLMNQLPVTHPWLYEQFSRNGYHTVRRTNKYWAGLSTDLLIEQTLMKSFKSQSGLTHGRGLTESVRNTWVYSMHESASLHMALKTAVKMVTMDSHHAECGPSRVNRDIKDTVKLLDWFRQHNPFAVNEKLIGLESGVTANDCDSVTCDNADLVGVSIQSTLDGLKFLEASIKKKSCVKTLKHLIVGGHHVDKKVIDIDPATLFYRFLILAERSADIPSYFKYELTTTPCSLFKDFTMNKADKPALVKAITKGMSEGEQPVQGLMLYIVDGGALLHHVKWLRNASMSVILHHYIRFVQSRYGQTAIIVFDGYESGASTKDHEHRRRQNKVNQMSPDVTCGPDIQVTYSQPAFLANQHNKVSFIALLANHLKAEGFNVTQAPGDADTVIAATALKIASNQAVAVAADDTDIIILLVHHLRDNFHDINFVSQRGQSRRSIRQIQRHIGKTACTQLPAIHAIGGCDTVSSMFGIGKGTVFQKLTGRSDLTELTHTLQDVDATKESVLSSGLRLISVLYGEKPDELLNSMRYKTFCNLSANSLIKLKPQKLPPTERAASFHVMRAHLQAVRWCTLDEDSLDPVEWGWRIDNRELVPITTDLPVAPQDILKVIRCKCKTSCKSASCTCRRNNLPCVTACASCHGDSCLNALKGQSDIADGDSTEYLELEYLFDIFDCAEEEVNYCTRD